MATRAAQARQPARPGPHGDSADPRLTDALVQLSFAVQSLLGRIAAEHDLSVIQARLLGVLRDREIGMLELSRILELEKSSVTGLVDRAERRGLVERVPSTADRRAVLVALTDHGRSVVSGAAALFEADVSLLLERLPPADRASLAGLISHLLVAHAADHGIDLFATATAAAGTATPGTTAGTDTAGDPGVGSPPPSRR